MRPSRVLAGLRDTLRLLSPAVRAERTYTQGRAALITRATARAISAVPWLEPGHGAGYDERVVEYPWVAAQLGSGDTLLDVGSTLNSDGLHRLALTRYGSVLHLNPYRDDGVRAADPRVRYLRADVRAPALRGGLALITCVSVLEHVGCDNSRYGGPAGAGSAGTRPAATDQQRVAMRQMRALLKPGGRLLLTVPFGRAEDHGWFRQFDQAALDAALDAFAPAAVTLRCFRHDNGWREVPAAACADASYGASGNRGATAVACAELSA